MSQVSTYVTVGKQNIAHW